MMTWLVLEEELLEELETMLLQTLVEDEQAALQTETTLASQMPAAAMSQKGSG